MLSFSNPATQDLWIPLVAEASVAPIIILKEFKATRGKKKYNMHTLNAFENISNGASASILPPSILTFLPRLKETSWRRQQTFIWTCVTRGAVGCHPGEDECGRILLLTGCPLTTPPATRFGQDSGL